ncbi:threonine-phosphate decarboxylase CobD [Bauldia sp.]|uniref:threonine-phosphate decarboxylase CobD n=1 Tax=Bauldia sp. TaxID=2575872 RepID=UPI003BA9A796
MEDTPRHGGDLAYATRRYGEPADGWLDLSTGVSPHPYPIDATAIAAALERLPEPAAIDRLIEAARDAWNIPPETAIMAVAGTEAAIRLVPHTLAATDVSVFAPTYGSHAPAWMSAGHRVVANDWPPSQPTNAAVAVLCNPNNPDGRLIGEDVLHRYVRDRTAAGRFTLIDEAFIDLSPDESLIPRVADLDCLLTRSFGKFFGLPGLRLGFVVGPPDRVEAIQGLLGDWPVSSAAVEIGTRALRDEAWQQKARSRLAQSANRLRSLLQTCGLTIVGGTDLFALVRDGNAPAIHRALARAGVWTRAFDDQPDWIRIGIPGDSRGFARLETVLAAIRGPSAG